MGKNLVSGSGNKIKNYVSLLPLGDRIIPVDVTLGTITSVAEGTNTFSATVTEATDTGRMFVLAGGSTVTFTWINTDTDLEEEFIATIKGTTMQLNKVDTFVHDLPPSSTAIEIEINEVFPEDKNITATFTSIVVPAKERLRGGTASGFSGTADKTDSTVHEDELAYADGVVTTASWEMSFTANCLSEDAGMRRVRRAWVDAIRGREIYIWQEEAPPRGYTIGDTTHGVAAVTAFAKDYPADGILTYNCTFSGNSAPIIDGPKT